MSENLKVVTRLSLGKTTELTIWQAMDMMVEGKSDPTISFASWCTYSNRHRLKMLIKRIYGTMEFFQRNLASAYSPMWVSSMSVLSDLINKFMVIYCHNKQLWYIYNFWLADKQRVIDSEVDITLINFPNYFKEPLSSVQMIIAAEQERTNHLEEFPLDEMIQYAKKMRGSISVLSILAEDLSNRTNAVVDFVNKFMECIYDTLPDDQKPDVTKLLSTTNGYMSAVMTRLECFIPVKEEESNK